MDGYTASLILVFDELACAFRIRKHLSRSTQIGREAVFDLSTIERLKPTGILARPLSELFRDDRSDRSSLLSPSFLCPRYIIFGRLMPIPSLSRVS